MKTLIADITAKKEIAYKAYRDYDKAIKALQAICEHKYEYSGHTHNDSEYTCTECGALEYR